MNVNIMQEEKVKISETAFQTMKNLRWIVRENDEIQAELNRNHKNGQKVSPKVVHKVVDRIREL